VAGSVPVGCDAVGVDSTGDRVGMAVVVEVATDDV